MGRKKLIVQEEAQVDNGTKLKDLIAYYGKRNEELNALKKVVGVANEEIKVLMPKLVKKDTEGNYVSQSGDYTATLRIEDRSTMNEEKLINWLKKKGLSKGIVKRREYVDSQALTDAIYNHVITEQQVTEMEVCKEPKIVPVLTIKKKKGDK